MVSRIAVMIEVKGGAGKIGLVKGDQYFE